MHPQHKETAGTIRSRLFIHFAVIFGGLAFYLLIASNALAAGGGAERVGKNLGDLLSTIGGYVLFGVAGLIALGMLASRKFSAIGALLLMCFVVGGLFFAGDELTNIVRSTWRGLARGT